MEKKKIVDLLEKVRAKRMSPQKAFETLRRLPYEDLGFAKVDHHRLIRTGFAEVIFCQGKTDPQILAVFASLCRENSRVLLTRCAPETFKKLRRLNRHVSYNEAARICRLMPEKEPGKGLVSVICAGTADLPVAEEAACTAETMGARVERRYDVGVAGVHRLLDCLKDLSRSSCIVAVAGMEGALPSVIGGLVSCPVISVPTAVGYGANFKGIAPLLTMLNSCAPGVTVVNIDNGFGAGYAAAMINAQSARYGQETAVTGERKPRRVSWKGAGKFKRLLPAEHSFGMKSGRVNLDSGEAVGEHSTGEREEAVVILSGKARVSIGKQKKFDCPHGTMIYIPPRTVHNIWNRGQKTLSYIYIVAPAGNIP